jgi:hypothetical protein
MLESLKNEIEVMKKLNSSNIVRMHNAFNLE